MAEETQGEMPELDMGTETEPEQQQAGNDGETPKVLLAELEETRKALQKANRESAQRRKKLEELEARERAREDAELSEMEKLQKQLDEIKAEKEQALKNAQAIQIKAAVIAKASALNFNDPYDAYALVDISQFEVSDEGVSGVDEALTELAESKPYMIKKAKPNTGPTNPGDGAGQGETLEQARQRIYGGGGQKIFDTSWAEQHGGGVRISEKSGT
jgi:hypothetical protein